MLYTISPARDNQGKGMVDVGVIFPGSALPKYRAHTRTTRTNTLSGWTSPRPHTRSSASCSDNST